LKHINKGLKKGYPLLPAEGETPSILTTFTPSFNATVLTKPIELVPEANAEIKAASSAKPVTVAKLASTAGPATSIKKSKVPEPSSGITKVNSSPENISIISASD